MCQSKDLEDYRILLFPDRRFWWIFLNLTANVEFTRVVLMTSGNWKGKLTSIKACLQCVLVQMIFWHQTTESVNSTFTIPSLLSTSNFWPPFDALGLGSDATVLFFKIFFYFLKFVMLSKPLNYYTEEKDDRIAMYYGIRAEVDAW